MALTGSLQDFNLFSIFSMIKSQNKIGTLFVTNENTCVKIIFDRGVIVGILSDDQNTEDGIFPVLLRLGIISHDELQNMLKIHNQTLKSIKKIALESGAITMQNIQDAYYMQAITIIYHLFLWTTANYHFDSIITDVIDRDAFPPIPVESVLIETAKFIDEWPRLQNKLPDHSQSLVKTSKINTGSNLSLSHEEEIVLSYFEHANSIQDTINISRYYELDTCQCIANLLEWGYLEVCDQKSVSAHPIMQGISDIQKTKVQISQKPSPILWPLITVFTVVPIFTYTTKTINGINLGISSIYKNNLIFISNKQTEERKAFVSILKNAITNNETLTIPINPSHNNIINNEIKEVFEQFDYDPLHVFLLKERR
jgi:hypothetical protein